MIFEIMPSFEAVKRELKESPRTWLVTGGAGFIGSHLLESLLKHDQRVVGLDNLSTGYRQNLDEVGSSVSQDQWNRFHFMEEDTRDLRACRAACRGVDVVLHQAALGSVPRSIDDPITTHQSNVDGFLNMLVAARESGVRRFVYAASSSTYGDHPDLPKVEERIGRPLSPYAVTKYVNELYAEVFARAYSFHTIGLRYFNVFGPRQDPKGAYAAVIPRWFSAMLNGGAVGIYGDGETTRDFCYIENCVQANLLAACTEDRNALDRVYNVAFGESTSLNRLFELIRESLSALGRGTTVLTPRYEDFRIGDVRHSLADITRARDLLGYAPEYSVRDGLKETAKWWIERTSAGSLGADK